MQTIHKNKIMEEAGDVLKVDISTPTHPEVVLTINKTDWGKLQGMTNGARFSAQSTGKRNLYGYRLTCGAYAQGHRVSAHRLLLPDCEAVKFLNGDALDLRRENMERSTRADCRKDKAHRDSRTGERCVSPAGSRYRLDVSRFGRAFYMGTFPDADAAAEARELIENELQGLDKADAWARLQALRNADV